MSDYITQLRKLVGTKPLILCSAGIIVLDSENRLLLQHRTDNDMWGIPGGALEPGERLEEAAVREVKEEVGLKCGSLELFGVYSGPELYYRYPNGDEAHIVTVIYLCRNFSGVISVDPAEGKEARFFAINNLPSQISPPIRPVIEDLKRRCQNSSGL